MEVYDRRDAKDLYEDFYSRKDFKHFAWGDGIEIRSLVDAFGLKGKVVADIGCGTGWYTALFRENGARAYGMDLTEAGIRKAIGHSGPRTCLVGDALALPFRSGSLDGVFLSGFPTYNAEDLSTQEAFVQSVIDLLKPEGILVFRKTTDLTGRKTTRMNHTLAQYEEHFAGLGSVRMESVFGANPLTWFVLRRAAMGAFGTAVATFITRITRMPLRATVVVRKTQTNQGISHANTD